MHGALHHDNTNMVMMMTTQPFPHMTTINDDGVIVVGNTPLSCMNCGDVIDIDMLFDCVIHNGVFMCVGCDNDWLWHSTCVVCDDESIANYDVVAWNGDDGGLCAKHIPINVNFCNNKMICEFTMV